jgi:hypothetical protein
VALVKFPREFTRPSAFIGVNLRRRNIFRATVPRLSRLQKSMKCLVVVLHRKTVMPLTTRCISDQKLRTYKESKCNLKLR